MVDLPPLMCLLVITRTDFHFNARTSSCNFFYLYSKPNNRTVKNEKRKMLKIHIIFVKRVKYLKKINFKKFVFNKI